MLSNDDVALFFCSFRDSICEIWIKIYQIWSNLCTTYKLISSFKAKNNDNYSISRNLISIYVNIFYIDLNSSLRYYDHTNRWSPFFVSDCIHFTPE